LYTLSFIELFFLEEMSRMITDTNEIAPDLALKPKLRKITFHPSQLTASKLIQWNRGT